MAKFRHVRTGKVIDVPDEDAHRYHNNRYQEVEDWSQFVRTELDPKATVAEVLAYVDANPGQRAPVLKAERAGKNRKGIIDALDG